MSEGSVRRKIISHLAGLDDKFNSRPRAMLTQLADESVENFNRLASNLGQEAEAMKSRHLSYFLGNAGLGLIGGTVVAIAFNPVAGLAVVGAGGLLALREATSFFAAGYRAQMAYDLRDEALQLNDAAMVQKTIRDALIDTESCNEFLYRHFSPLRRRLRHDQIYKS